MNFVPKCESTSFHAIWFCILIFFLYLHERSVIFIFFRSLSWSNSTGSVTSNRLVAYKLPGFERERELEVRALTGKARDKTVSSSFTDLLSNCCQVLPSLHLCFFSLYFVFLVRFQIIFRWGIISRYVCGASSTTELQC